MADKNGDERGSFFTWLKYQAREKFSVVVTTENAPSNSAFGEGLVAQIMPQTAWRFDYGINTRFVSTSGTINGGYVTEASSQARLGTSTNVSGTAQVMSIRPLRYLPGYGGLCRFTAVFASGTPSSEQMAGLSDVNNRDGLAFGYNGSSFGVLWIVSGTKNWIPQSEWNGPPFDYDIIPQYGNVYQIRFQWLGYGNIYFMVFDKIQRKFVVVHTLEYPNAYTRPSIINPTLRLFARIRNSGNNTDLNMFTPSALGALEGHTNTSFENPLNIANSADRLVSFSDTNNNHAITIRNKSTFGGVANRIPVQITSITISRTGGAATSPNSTVRIYRNVQTAGALSYSDVDANNSPVEVSVTTTTITSTNAERSYSISQNTTFLPIQFKQGEMEINPGESLTVGVADSGVQATEFSVTINWDELF